MRLPLFLVILIMFGLGGNLSLILFSEFLSVQVLSYDQVLDVQVMI
jgi:hypothetical protein